MKKICQVLGFITFFIILTLSITTCDEAGASIQDLTGTISFNSTSSKEGVALTAIYNPGNGTGQATWLWYRITLDTDVSLTATGNTYTPVTADIGFRLKAVVSFADQNGSLSGITTNFVVAADPPPVCECPNGTNHPDDPCACGTDDCACTNNPIVIPAVCECPAGTIHYDEDCPCDTEDCDCERVNTPADITLGGDEIDVVAGDDIDAHQTIAALVHVQGGYNALSLDAKSLLAGQIKKISIIGGATVEVQVAGGYEFSFNVNATATDITARFNVVANAIDAANELANMPTNINLGGNKPLTVAGGIRSDAALAARTVIEGAYNGFAHTAHLTITSVEIVAGSSVSLAAGKLTIGVGANAGAITTEFTNIVSCVCPPDNIYVTGETCTCGKPVCNCQIIAGARTSVPGKASNGIAITNREDDIGFDATVGNINTALDHANLSSEARQNFIKNNIKEIRVITLPTSNDIYVTDDVLIIPSHRNALAIRNALTAWCEENEIVMLQMDKTIRLVNGRTTSLREITALGKKLDTAKVAGTA